MIIKNNERFVQVAYFCLLLFTFIYIFDEIAPMPSSTFDIFCFEF